MKIIQQQLPESSRISGVWGDPNVHDLIPMCTRHTERSVPIDPQKTILEKTNDFEKCFVREHATKEITYLESSENSYAINLAQNRLYPSK